MKCLLINLIVFIIFVNSDTSKRLFLPQLPVGEYRVKYLGIVSCDSIQSNDLIKFNYYLSKTSANTTELKGNATYLVPLDDSFNIEINMAIKDSIGAWKENAHIYKTPKACSSMKMLFGAHWTQIMECFGFYNVTCPLPAGFYEAPGYNTDNYLFSNLPKKFFYGTYKMRYIYSKNNVVYACTTFVLEVKRPWETD